jgi:hypothetical protein
LHPGEQAALKVLDQKVCDKMKKLNALKHTTQTYRRRLEDLQTLYQSMKLENRGPERDTERRSEEAKVLYRNKRCSRGCHWNGTLFSM